MRSKRLGFAVLLGFVTLGNMASAQQDLFYDTVDVRVVTLEVMVTDGDGQPVRGLGKDDFQLLVDKQPVSISNFFAVEKGTAVVDDPAAAPEALPQPETERLNLVVFLDDVHISPMNRNQILSNLRRYLVEEVGGDDQVMLARLSDEMRVEQGFTSDKEALFSTLDRLESSTGRQISIDASMRQLLSGIESTRLGNDTVQVGPVGVSVRDAELTENTAESQAGQVETLARQRYQLADAALGAMRGFVDTLAGMKGRKALLYVSDGIPLNPGEGLAQAWIEKYERWIIDQQVSSLQGRLTSLVALDLDLTEELGEFNGYASSSRVSIYPISLGTRLAREQASAARAGTGSIDGGGGASRGVAALEQFSVESSLLQMAAETGGVAYTRSANIGDLMDQVKQDFETFYSLGYSPTRETDGPVDVEVRVQRPDVVVRHVRSVESKDPLDRLQDLTLSALHHGIEDNPLGVRLESGDQEPSEGGRVRVSLMVQIPFGNLLLLPQEAHHAGRVTLFVIIRDEETRGMSPFQHIELPLQVPNDQILQVLTQAAAYPLNLNMEPGRKRISVGVRDHLARTDATLTVEIDVDAGNPARGSAQ
ncbi:MAG: VWA domain-containing protein [Acidobacteriota bacterium]